MSQSESRGSWEWSPHLPHWEAGDSSVSRLNLGCFFQPNKKKLFKGWCISNVCETGFSKLNKCLDTCFNPLTTSCHKIHKSLVHFYVLYLCQTSNIYLPLNPQSRTNRSSRKATFSCTCYIMCHMARTANKVKTLPLIEFLLPVFTEALSTEKATHLSHGIWHFHFISASPWWA